jgi:hemin uptake protein HemP
MADSCDAPNVGGRTRVSGSEYLPERRVEASRRAHAVPAPRGPSMRTVQSTALLGGEGLLGIEHNGALYTLRRTRNGRLILTK